MTVGTDGRVVGAAPFTRARTTSVVLDGPRLFTTSGYRLTLSDLQGQVEDTWPLVAEGGWAPTLAESRATSPCTSPAPPLTSSTSRRGADVRLELPQPGPSVDVDLTPEGLFYGYDAPYTRQPGRLGYVALQDLVAVASGSLNG